MEYQLFTEKDNKVDRSAKKAASEFAVYAVAFSPDGTLLASGGLDKIVRIWDVATGELKQTIQGHSGFVNDLAFTPPGDRLLSCGHSGKLQLWNVASGVEKWSVKLPSLVQAAALAPDGSRLAIACADSKAYLVTLPR